MPPLRASGFVPPGLLTAAGADELSLGRILRQGEAEGEA